MKLGYLVSQYPAINHTFILREICELRKLGFDVFALSVRRPDRPVAEMTSIEADEARRSQAILGLSFASIVRIHFLTLLRRPGNYFRGFAAALRLGAENPAAALNHMAYFAEAVVAGHLFLKAGVDHFHVHFTSTAGWLITRIFPLGMSITFHGPVEFFQPAAFHMREKVKASVFVRGISSFGVSQMMMAAEYSSWSRIEMVRLGVDGASFTPCRRERGQERPPDSVFELLCVGRLADVKGQHILLDAVAELIAKGYSVRLRLVGDGPDRGALAGHAERVGIASCVVFEGWTSQDRIRDFYARADFFVLASFAEGIPVVLMEAMAMEVPVIATWVNGVPELVENGVNGLLCAPGDCAGLAECVARLIRDPHLRAQMGAAGRRTVLEKYDLTRNAQVWAAVLERRLEKSGKS